MPKLEKLRFRAPSGCGEQTGYNAYYICNADGCKDCQAVNLEEQCDIAVKRVS
jgi:hypothetical protein